jgi:hypothetical protein
MNNAYIQDQNRGWCLILLDLFRNMQAQIPAIADLRPPNIVLSPTLTRTLGQWDEEHRQVILSQRILVDGNFSLLIDVFKHEVAHQVVSELYGIRNAVHHGKAFTRACRLLGIPSREDDSFQVEPDEVSHKLLERVQKLTAMGASHNIHEAEAALKKARELTLKYNLEMLNSPNATYDLRPVGPIYKRVPSYIWSICGIISDFYYCLYICRSVEYAGKAERIIELYGERENLETAEYVYHFLINQGELEWQRFRSQNGIRGRKLRQSFLKGLYAGFRESLSLQTEQLAQQKALVWAGDPHLDAFFRQRNPRVRSRQVQSQVYTDTHSAGEEVGRNLSIRPGVKEPSTSGRRRGLLR